MLKDERFIAVALVVLATAIGGTVGSDNPNCNECREYLAGIMRRVHILRVLRLERSAKDKISPAELETINLCRNKCIQSELVDSNMIRRKRNVVEDSYQYFYPHYGDKIIGLLNYDGYDLPKNEAGEEGKYVPFLYDESTSRFMDGFEEANRNWEHDYNVAKEPLLFPEDEGDYARKDQFLEKIVNRFRDVVAEEFRSQFLQVPGYIGYQQNNLILPIIASRTGDVEAPTATEQAITSAPEPSPQITKEPVNDRPEGTARVMAMSFVTNDEAVPASGRPEVATATAAAIPYISIMDQKPVEPIPAPVAVASDETDNAPASPPSAGPVVADMKPSKVEPESAPSVGSVVTDMKPSKVEPESAPSVGSVVTDMKPSKVEPESTPSAGPVVADMKPSKVEPESTPSAGPVVADMKPSGVEPESAAQDMPDGSQEDSEVPDVTTPFPEELPMEKADAQPLPQKSFRNEDTIYPIDCRRNLQLKH